MRWSLAVALDIARTAGLALACSGVAIAYERAGSEGSLMALCGGTLVLIAVAAELRLAAREPARLARAPAHPPRAVHPRLPAPVRVLALGRIGMRRRSLGRAQLAAGRWRRRCQPDWHATQRAAAERRFREAQRRRPGRSLRTQAGSAWAGRSLRRGQR
jgi:hypothetical protein